MESLYSILQTIQPEDFLAFLDLTEAYRHLPMCLDAPKFLSFAYNLGHFHFKALPFRLASKDNGGRRWAAISTLTWIVLPPTRVIGWLQGVMVCLA